MYNDFEETEMDMPTPCQHCGDIFDLFSGGGSEKWHPDTIICSDCSNKEQDEIEEDERWENINMDLSNGLYGLDKEKDIMTKLDTENIQSLRQLSMRIAEPPSEVKFSRIEIEQLQTKIHQITGDGEVMKIFNSLLGINAG